MNRILLVYLIFTLTLSVHAQKTGSMLPQISEKVQHMTLHEGFFNFYQDDKEGKIWLEIDESRREFLMVSYLSMGMGSNDVGLDRGKIGAQKVVEFQRSGNKVLLIEPNYKYRAHTEDAREKKAVEESFARSVIWGFKVEAEEKGKMLIDLSPLLISDQNQVSAFMRFRGQGNYKVDETRSALNMDRTRNFPGNTEFDVNLSFSGQPEGSYVMHVVPTAGHMTLGQHISFVALPELGSYQPRIFLPGSGYISLQYMDMAVSLGESLTQRLIYRHKLEKRNPSASVSEAVEPIVYYLDPGTPEPMRTALLEGAAWWNEAFEEIGYKDAFQVRLLPDDADPLDIRYNVIQWVHRATRGWSYGSTITDPRTGEILKGHVSLGSQRVRQDYMIAEALLAPYAEGSDGGDAMKDMALARLRQLSAHEVGHTLGFVHNYVASADDRSSVMDYPHPLVKLIDGELILEEAYDTGLGEWDKVMVAYGYTDIPGNLGEAEALKQVLEDARMAGLRFLSDQDARPQGSAHPATHLWDNGGDATEELIRVMTIRQHMLHRFSALNIKEGIPYSELADVLVPAYLFHRFQLEAAVKVIGGLEYNYALKGEDLNLKMLPSELQDVCLDAVLTTLAPDFLAIPPSILDIIPPKPLGYENDRENFQSRTGLTFDPMAAAESAADMTLSLLLHPQRASRLVVHKSRDPGQPGLQVVLDKLVFATWQTAYDDPYLSEVHRVINTRVLSHLIRLASDQSAMVQARAIAHLEIVELGRWLEEQLAYTGRSDTEAHYRYALQSINAYLDDPQEYEHATPLEIPPGQPIGDCGIEHLW